jgi:hypothetical protein
MSEEMTAAWKDKATGLREDRAPSLEAALRRSPPTGRPLIRPARHDEPPNRRSARPPSPDG